MLSIRVTVDYLRSLFNVITLPFDRRESNQISHAGVKNPNDLVYSLNLLVLLLPVEHRCTLEALLNFLKLIIENQTSNKMSIHNVAMIVAPSLFPPRYIYPRDRADLTAQVNMAAVCCQMTEALLNNIDKLWYVPTELINQLRRQSEVDRYRKCKKKYYWLRLDASIKLSLCMLRNIDDRCFHINA